MASLRYETDHIHIFFDKRQGFFLLMLLTLLQDDVLSLIMLVPILNFKKCRQLLLIWTVIRVFLTNSMSYRLWFAVSKGKKQSFLFIHLPTRSLSSIMSTFSKCLDMRMSNLLQQWQMDSSRQDSMDIARSRESCCLHVESFEETSWIYTWCSSDTSWTEE